jgi:Tfp pilus assembly protein PilX
VPDRLLRAVRRTLGDERGLALPMALGLTMVLSALAAGIFAYVTMNQGSARRAQADQRAYGLAETGLSYALSRVQATSNPYDANAVPSTTVALTGGSTTYSGSLSGTMWTLTGSGTVTNPSGPHAGNITRTASLQAQITTSSQADMRPWDYLFIDQPSGCITMGNSVSMDVSLYVRGNLCLTNNSQIDSPAVHLLGDLSVENSAQIGTVTTPIGEFAATGTCSYGGSVTTCGPSSHVYASSIGTGPPTIAKPTIDLASWYANSSGSTSYLGPAYDCTSGTFPGGFDNDTTLNVSRGDVDLTPSTGYDCKRGSSTNPDAQIKWDPATGVLTIEGVIYVDGNLTWSNLNLITYSGKAVIYASGQIVIRNRADLCGVAACDDTWNPQQDLIVLIAGSLISQTTTDPTSGEIGNHVNFQGAIYTVTDYVMDNNTTVWGPVITRSASIANSAIIHAPPQPILWMEGMPGATQTVTEVNVVQGSYSG